MDRGLSISRIWKKNKISSQGHWIIKVKTILPTSRTKKHFISVDSCRSHHSQVCILPQPLHKRHVVHTVCHQQILHNLSPSPLKKQRVHLHYLSCSNFPPNISYFQLPLCFLNLYLRVYHQYRLHCQS